MTRRARAGGLVSTRSLQARERAMLIYGAFAVLLFGTALLAPTPEPARRVVVGDR